MGRPFVGAEILKKAFPLIRWGEAFEDQFLASAQKSGRFAALVIRVDDLDRILEERGEDEAAGILKRFVEIMTQVAKTRAVEWGRLDQYRFACFCPEIGEADAVEFAREVQQSLLGLGDETISAGIAVYPFWPFEKKDVLANAQKALDHAAFLGPGTVTPFDAVSLNISADRLYQQGDICGAVEELEKALAIDRQNVNVLNSLGVCYGAQGELESAVDAFEKAIAMDPTDMMAKYNLGLARLKQGDKKNALSLFLEAHSLDGESPEVAYQIGICYGDMGQTDAALEYLEKAARNRPKGAHIYQALGDHYMERGMLPDAAKAYERALKNRPRQARNLSTLGHLYGMLGENLEIAIIFCEESVAIEPRNGRYRLRLGELYLKKGNHEKAIEQLKAAARLGEDSSELLDKAQRAVDTLVEDGR